MLILEIPIYQLETLFLFFLDESIVYRTIFNPFIVLAFIILYLCPEAFFVFFQLIVVMTFDLVEG
jgi:hypothetical protein